MVNGPKNEFAKFNSCVCFWVHFCDLKAHEKDSDTSEENNLPIKLWIVVLPSKYIHLKNIFSNLQKLPKWFSFLTNWSLPVWFKFAESTTWNQEITKNWEMGLININCIRRHRIDRRRIETNPTYRLWFPHCWLALCWNRTWLLSQCKEKPMKASRFCTGVFWCLKERHIQLGFWSSQTAKQVYRTS